jgi:hypothetical protein
MANCYPSRKLASLLTKLDFMSVTVGLNRQAGVSEQWLGEHRKKGYNRPIFSA